MEQRYTLLGQLNKTGQFSKVEKWYMAGNIIKQEKDEEKLSSIGPTSQVWLCTVRRENVKWRSRRDMQLHEHECKTVHKYCLLTGVLGRKAWIYQTQKTWPISPSINSYVETEFQEALCLCLCSIKWMDLTTREQKLNKPFKSKIHWHYKWHPRQPLKSGNEVLTYIFKSRFSSSESLFWSFFASLSIKSITKC